MRDIVILVVCGVLIAAGVFIFLSRSEAPQTVALEPVQAVPMRIPNASTDPPAPPAPVRRAEPLEPRPEPPAPVTRTTPPPASSTATDQTDTTPEPSERPSDTSTTPSSADSTGDTSSTTPPTPPAAVPSSLPVRNSTQGWGVQAGAFRTSANAIALRDRLLKSGLAARVEPVDNGIYRVIVGAYATADAARAASAGVLAALR